MIVLWYLFVIGCVSSVAYVSFRAGVGHERKAARVRRERRIAAGIERREVARPDTGQAQVKRATISGSMMQEK